MPSNLKQRCFLAVVYASWIGLAGFLALLVWRSLYVMALAALLGLPLAQWFYVKYFRWLSPWMGYGEIVDEPGAPAGPAPAKVTLYTALGCPFCPLIERRLEALRQTMGFELHKVDVTLKPALLSAKGIRSVPVVEVGDTQLIGLVTSSQLAEAIQRSANRTEALA